MKRLKDYLRGIGIVITLCGLGLLITWSVAGYWLQVILALALGCAMGELLQQDVE